jgi:hypothetical protein
MYKQEKQSLSLRVASLPGVFGKETVTILSIQFQFKFMMLGNTDCRYVAGEGMIDSSKDWKDDLTSEKSA